MKDKILFWIDTGIIHFGIAKFLQEKYDADMYAIYDLFDIQKKTFSEQKFVNFEKIWFFRDYISKHTRKPDIKYLKNIEKKYKINLWMIAYTERIFDKWNKYYKFDHDEILTILEQECRFFESVLNEVKPDFLIIKLTDFHRNHMLELMCKGIGIKVMMLYASRFGSRAMISEYFDVLDHKNEYDAGKNDNKTESQLLDYFKQANTFKLATSIESGGISLPILKKLLTALKFFGTIYNANYTNFYHYYGRTPLRIIKNEISKLLRVKYREYFLKKNCKHEININEKFVYFPLHVEPERGNSIDTPFFGNQLELITNIAKALPIEFKLYVKEHPVMRIRGWREISYYKKILELPNVELLHPQIHPEEIMNGCSLVFNLIGTSGLEALFHKKPSIVFSDVSYHNIPSVFRVRNIEELPHIIRSALQKKIDVTDLNKYVNLLNENSFEFDMINLFNKTANKFYTRGYLTADKISLKDMESFLEENKKEFELLALEHLKKIQHHKNYNLK